MSEVMNVLGDECRGDECQTITRPKLFQTERTWRLACLPSFCELVSLEPFPNCGVLYLLLNFQDHACFMSITRKRGIGNIGGQG